MGLFEEEQKFLKKQTGTPEGESLFTEPTKIELGPQSEASKAGQAYLTKLIGTAPNVALQGTAGLTPVQMAIQQSLSGLLAKSGQAGDLASKEYSSILEGDYDPRTSPYYEGLRQEAERLKKEGVTGLRQRAELGGMLGSSTGAVAEGSFVSEANSALLKELGRLMETERGRKLLAAEGIQGAEAQRLGNIAAVGGIADIERDIEQQRADALYEQAMQQMLFPYQYQANIANSLLGYSPETVITGGGLSDFGYMTQSMGSAFKSYMESRSGKGGKT